MSAYSSVTIVSTDGEESLSILADADGRMSFDPSNAGATFAPAKVAFALEFLQEIGGK